MALLKDSWVRHVMLAAVARGPLLARLAELRDDELAEEQAQQRHQDREDLAAEMAGLETGKMRRFIREDQSARARECKEREDAKRTAAALMAQWDAQRTVVGGIAMTNAEAQTARRRVMENGDHYARLARERFHPGADPKRGHSVTHLIVGGRIHSDTIRVDSNGRQR